MIQRRTCPFVGEPADFPASSLPTRRDILKFVQFLRLNTVTKLSNDGLFDIVSKRFVFVLGAGRSLQHSVVSKGKSTFCCFSSIIITRITLVICQFF